MMYDDFLQQLKEVFPVLYDDNSKAAIESLRQFYRRKKQNNDSEEILPQITSNPKYDALSQGDIISDIPFFYIDNGGNLSKIVSKGMILSSTCDIENDDNILISPCFSLSDLDKLDKTKLIRNTYFKFFCLNNSSLESDCLCVDFSLTTSYSTKLITKRVDEKTINRLFSLTLVGYYLFIMKMSVHFLRKEDTAISSVR